MSRHTDRVKGHMFSLICRNWQSWGNSSAELPWWLPLWPHATLSKNISMISSLSLMVAGHYDDNFTLLIRWLPLWLGGTTSWVSFNSSSVYSPTSTAYTDNNKVYWSFTIILSKVNVPLGELRGALDVFRGQTLTFKKVMWEWLHCGDVSLSLLRSSVSSLLLYPWGRPWLGRVTLHTKAAPFALLTSGDIPVGRAGERDVSSRWQIMTWTLTMNVPDSLSSVLHRLVTPWWGWEMQYTEGILRSAVSICNNKYQSRLAELAVYPGPCPCPVTRLSPGRLPCFSGVSGQYRQSSGGPGCRVKAVPGVLVHVCCRAWWAVHLSTSTLPDIADNWATANI